MAASVTKLPRKPRPPRPLRPLGQEGKATWNRIWGMQASWIDQTRDLEHVTVLCECMDERVGLRVKILRDPDDWRSRAALRALDAQVIELVGKLGLNPTDRQALSVVDVPKGKLAELRRARGEA